MDAEARIEAGTLPDGRSVYLLAVRAAGQTAAVAVIRLPAGTAPCGEDLLHASGLFTANAFEAALPDFADTLTPRALHEQDLHDLSLFHAGRSRRLANALGKAATALAGDRGAIAGFINYRGLPGTHRMLGLVPDCTLNDRYPGFPMKEAPRAADLPPTRPVTGTRFRLPTADPEMTRAIEAWQRALLAAVQPPDRISLNAATWSTRTYAYLSADGTRGTWRRQAARLYPAFAPALAVDPELGRLVDAGEPFEHRLRDLLRETMRRRPLLGGDALSHRITLGMVRRMRGLDRAVFMDGPLGIHVLLGSLCTIPPEIVPHDTWSWNRLLREGVYPLRIMAAYDLPRERALRGIGADWHFAPVLGMLDATERKKVLDDLCVELHDMATAFAATLLGPACADFLPEGLDRVTLAGHLLFRSDDLAGMNRRQMDWHAALPGLPSPNTGGAPWPALFAPYERDGIRIACLTSQDALTAEGGAGADGEGVAGLDHCVGGYAGSCREGRCHVASVRSVGPDGREKRLATAEIVPAETGFAIRQLRGRRNASTSPKVTMAVAALITDLNAGAHPHDLQAARLRPLPTAPVATVEPELLTAVLAAWRPLLPRALRVRDVEGLRERVRKWLDKARPLGGVPARHAA